MKKRSEESRKRLKKLWILLLLTCILAVLSTYAWFSTQRAVELTGLNVNVDVAESMQISLDGENWTQSIAITDMNQLLGTASGDVYQANPDEHTNYVPTELVPVSTIGTVKTGILQMVYGTIRDNKILENIQHCSEENLDTAHNSEHPYLVFDLYLRNTSGTTPGTLDTIQLDAGSSVWASTAGVGLPESARVAFVAYNTNSQNVGLTADGTTIRAIEGTNGDPIAIWEPNFNNHTQYVVDNDPANRIPKLNTVYNTLAINDSVSASSTINDVTVTSANDQLVEVFTNKIAETNRGVGAGSDRQAKETAAASNLKLTDGSTDFGIYPNTITKVRVYIWLEGQDPDCIDLASTGEMLNADIKLVKPVAADGPDGP